MTLFATSCAASNTTGSQGSASTTPEPTALSEPTAPAEPTTTPKPGSARQIGDVEGAVDSWFVPQLVVVDACNQTIGLAVECYELTVAADREDPSGGTAVLPVQVRTPRSLAADDVPAHAVVAPAGGPGYSGLTNSIAATLGQVEVAYDQRGTGDAQPSLDCLGADTAVEISFQAAGSYEDERAVYDAALAQCLRDFEAASIDLTDYNSIASAHDLEDLRVALDIEQWNMVGVSYGGRLTLTTMREHPHSIRAVVLDSVYDLSYGGFASTVTAIDRGFDALVGACATSAPCAERGDLGEMLERVRLKLNDSPIKTTVDFRGEPTEVVVTGDDIIALLFVAMYNIEALPLLPSIISQLDQGDATPVNRLFANGLAYRSGFSDVMNWAMDCADNAGLESFEVDAQAHDDPGRYSSFLDTQCPVDWPSTSPDFNEPVVSDIPALLLAGGHDPITPPEPTLALADYLTNSTSVFMPAGGHGVGFVDPCMVSIIVALFDDPTSPPDTSCASTFDELAPA